MPLKYRYTTRQEIPSEQVSLYVERDGAWSLDAEGIVEKSKLDEFRNSNVTLLKERDELARKFEGIDPVEVRKLTEEKQRLELLAQGHKPEEVEKIIDKRLKSARVEWDKQMSAVTTERDALHGRLSAIQIDQAVVNEATRRGLRPTAIPDITARARSTFKLSNGVPQAFDNDGQTVRPGKDGISPMNLAEWLDDLVSDAPHLFESNAGGGAAGNASGGSGNRSAKNPFRKETWNLTEQMKLQKTDPHLAARLKASA